MPESVDVIIIGAGAAGLMCALTAGYRGRRVLVLDHANKPGKKILMSGGGRCNFTNLNTTPKHFRSNNPAFCISALRRYTPQDFVDMVERHGIEYVEKAPGQLFCGDEFKSKAIVQMLLTECEWAGVEVRLQTSVTQIQPNDNGFALQTAAGKINCESLVIASGGLSVPTMGASGFGYDVARQFGLDILPTRAGLVPFTLHPEQKQHFAPLSGVACDVAVTCRRQHFKEPMLFTHRGLSGPAMLQISSFWEPGDELTVDLLPDTKIAADLINYRNQQPKNQLLHWLNKHLPKRVAQTLVDVNEWQSPMQAYSNEQLAGIEQQLHEWMIKPAGTEGYRTAEVTLGGVNTDGISSKTFECHSTPGLYFIGEVLDVTGELGGFNFQWAWASGYCAGQYV